MMYGEHFDAAIMPQPNTVLRADLSFTLFLSDPSTYDGGELVVKIMDMEHAVKPDAGDMFVYPSGNRHRVNVITGGCREAGVGWVQSIHASPDRRRVLQNIRSVYNQLLTEDGKSEQFDLLNEAAVTLERMWANP
jgi:PKHD-type hydroxylase